VSSGWEDDGKEIYYVLPDISAVFWLSRFQVVRPKTTWRAGSTCGAAWRCGIAWARGRAAGAASGARGLGAEARGGALGAAGGA
jgi:hypothetical protein